MSKAAGWNAYQNRRRAGMTGFVDGVSQEEIGRLGSATASLIGGMADGTLAFSGSGLLRFLGEHSGVLGVEPFDYDPEPRGSDLVSNLRSAASQLRHRKSAKGMTVLERQLSWLGDTLLLDALDRDILAVFARASTSDLWRSMLSALPGGRGMRPATIAMLVGVPAEVVEAKLEPISPLIRAGLIVDEQDGDFRSGRFLRRIARLRSDDPEVLTARMLPPSAPSSLTWQDFEHLGRDRDLACRVVQNAAAQGQGVNILFYGMPGTGKSEFVRAIADRLSSHAIFAGLTDDEGGEPNRSERVAHLNVIRSLTQGSKQHLIVVDEADDVLRLPRETDRAQMSKLWLNRMVEDAQAPTIWIANEPEVLGDTIIRRMTMAIGFTLPPVQVRARIVKRAASTTGLLLNDDAIAAVAALPVAPAVLANAVGAAHLIGGGGEEVRHTCAGLLRALGGKPPAPGRLPAAYDPALAQANQDLAALADRLAATPRRGWSLLLSGPSGTGKSAFARHLGERLGIEVEERRGSDLLGMYVGETEANIARAFRDTADRGAMLLIDEADAFLFDRKEATRSWETGMVAEMLRWMEHHPAPFIATTNRADILDPATQRRFTLVVEFCSLTPARAAALFAAVLGAPLPTGAQPLEGVTPGDIGVVAKRARLLGEMAPVVLAAWVRAEVEARDGGATHAGFHMPSRSAIITA